MTPKSSDVNSTVQNFVALTVAGFDPSTGAGATADLAVFHANGLQGTAALTALTVQSARGVRRVEPVAAPILRETLGCLAEDLEIDGVKIGMLATEEIVQTVAEFLRYAGIERYRVVLDPVIQSSSGRALLSLQGVERMRSELLPLVGWITPNVDEAAALTGLPAPQREDVPKLARRLAEMTPGSNVVITGGHLEPPDDYLLTASGEEAWFPGQRVEARSIHGTHGTGCVFSSALLCGILLGDEPAEAVRRAKAAVVQRLTGE